MPPPLISTRCVSLRCSRTGWIDEWLKPEPAGELAAGHLAGEVQRLENELHHQIERQPRLFERLRLGRRLR